MDAAQEAKADKTYAPQMARNVASCQARGKAKELCDGRGARNAEGKFWSGDAGRIRWQSSDADNHGSGNIAGDEMRGRRLVAEVAGLAIRAGFTTVIMPGAAADQRKHKQKRGEYGAELDGSNCAVLLHS